MVSMGHQISAQIKGVAINENEVDHDPSSILDVSSTTRGVLLSRMTLAQRDAIVSPATGLMVYVTTAGSDGYHVYNGTTWEPIAGGHGNGLYGGNGNLSGNTKVTQGANTLDFTSTIVDGFAIDGITFSVDALNNRVGIGTAAPTEKLHVIGDALISSQLKIDGTAVFGHKVMIGSATGEPFISFSDGTTFEGGWGIASAAGQFFNGAANGDMIMRNDAGNILIGFGANAFSAGNVGIGEDAPSARLDVVGDIEGSAGMSIDGTTFNVDDANNRVGIGTAVPTKTLDVSGLMKSTISTAGSQFNLWENNSTTGFTFMRIENDGGIGAQLFAGGSLQTAFHVDYRDKGGMLAAGSGARDLVIEAVGDGDVYIGSENAGLSAGLAASTAIFVQGSDLNIGISTESPSATLDVVGDVEISDDLNVDTNLLFADASTNKVAIGTTVLTEMVADLNFNNVNGAKISMFPFAGDFFGFAITPATLESIVPLSTSQHQWGFGTSGSMTVRMTLDDVGLGVGVTPTEELHSGGNLLVDSLSSNVLRTVTLGVAATTFAIASNGMTITGDAGSNTITTITGATNTTILVLEFVDALITITDDNTHASNTVDLSAAFTSVDDAILTQLGSHTHLCY